MEKLHILWTSDNKDTAINMLSMYVKNAVKKEWWDEISIIIWGASAELAGKDEDVRKQIRDMKEMGVDIKACIACAENMGVTDELKDLGIEVDYMGETLSGFLKSDSKMLSI